MAKQTPISLSSGTVRENEASVSAGENGVVAIEDW
jgi:hypothetical protein